MTYLTRTDATHNIERFYIVDVTHDLFGGWVVAREWGRRGSPRTLRHDTYRDRADADARHDPLIEEVEVRIRLGTGGQELARQGEEVRFALDSLLEGDGFELSVPRVMGGRFRTTVPAAIPVFEVAGTAVALPRQQGSWPGPSSRIPR
jgi:predicted DNA-binding WGR domain protein